MSKQLESSMKLFSVGYVTQNKAYNARIIQALPVESASGTDGEVTHNPVEEILKGVDSQGNAYEVRGIATRDLECEWYPFDDNRVTPPDVRRGELVEIYRLGNSAKYFWRCMNMRNGLRTLEHVVNAYGAKPEASGAGVDIENCYTTIISPLNGYINVQTTKSNKEPYAYTIQINTKDGMIVVTDDVGNYFELNSKDSRLMLQNVDKSYIKVEKQWIEMKADKYIKMTCGGSVYEMKPDSISSTTTNYSVQSTQATIVGSASIGLQGQTITATCGRWDFV